MTMIASQITSHTIVYATICSEFPAQMAVKRKMFPFGDVIMDLSIWNIMHSLLDIQLIHGDIYMLCKSYVK